MTPPFSAVRSRFTAAGAAAAVLLCAIAALACVMPAQTDTWWLLRTGEETWRTGHIVLHDSFTHTVSGGYWPNHEWLSQVVFFAVYRVGSMPLLTAVCAAVVVIAWGLIWTMTAGETVDRVLLVGVGAALSTAGWSLRPQVFTIALFALSMRMLATRRRLYALPIVFLLWANLHGGVAAGGVLVLAALIASLVHDKAVSRTLLAVSALCLLATAITPLGTSLWLEIPASLQRLKAYDVIEWRAPSIMNPADLPFFAAFAVALVLAVKHRAALADRQTLFLAIASALTAVLALRSARNAGLFFLCVVPLLSRLVASARTRPMLQEAEPRAQYSVFVAAAVVVTIVFVTFAWSRPLERLQWNPVSPMLYNALQSCAGPLYNRYDEGGYLIWFVRDRPVFIDSRQDPFPESFVREQLDVERTGQYQATFERHKIACALAQERSRLSAALASSGWRPHDAGTGWIVYTRPDAGS